MPVVTACRLLCLLLRLRAQTRAAAAAPDRRFAAAHWTRLPGYQAVAARLHGLEEECQSDARLTDDEERLLVGNADAARAGEQVRPCPDRDCFLQPRQNLLPLQE